MMKNSTKLTIGLKKCLCVLVIQGFISYTLAQNGDNTLKFNHITTENGLPQNTVYSIIKDKYGFMWFATWGGAVRYDGYSFKVFRASENDSTALSSNIIKLIITDSNKNIWVETNNLKYLYRYNYEYENFTRFLFDKVPKHVREQLKKWKIKTFKTVENNSYKWNALSQGLQQIHKSTGQQSIYLADHSRPFTLSDNRINFIYLDDCENLWIGTQNGGVNYASLKIKAFSYYYANGNGKGLNDNIVRAICKDNKGRLWVGSEDKGISIITPSQNQNKYSYLGKDVLKDLRIRSLFCDRHGAMWIGTNGGLYNLNPVTNKFKYYATGAPKGTCDPRVFSIIEDHEGTIWIGTLNGLMKYDRLNDSFVFIDHRTTGGVRIRDIFEDHNHNLWIGTDDGGLTRLQYTSRKYNISQIKTTRYTHKEGDENTIINNSVTSLSEDLNGMIWVGTNSGLSMFNPQTNRFKHFTIKTGLVDDIIMGTMFDGKNHVWISHKKGLTQIDIKTFESQNFNTFDGLQGNEFCQKACFRDTKSDKLYFGGTNGLNSFQPDEIRQNKYKPHVALTRLNVMNQTLQPGTKVHNRVILQKSLLCTDKITLTWRDETFNIEFSALHFANPLGNKYKYKLEGYDKDWIYTDASMRIASYSYLPAGDYQFSVYAANSDGLWSDKPAILQITKLPPWWLTWWCKIFYVVLVFMASWVIFRYATTRIKLRNELLVEKLSNEKNKELANIKLKFFTEISHEFRTPLTLIIDPIEQLLTGTSDEKQVRYYYELMNRNAKQLLGLINQLLDFRKLQSNKMTLKYTYIDMVTFVRNVATSFEIKAADHHINFTVVSDVDFMEVAFDSDSMRKILYNLISNAFRFTPDYGEIIIHISEKTDTPDTLLIEIQDSGVGIAPEHHDKIFDTFYQVEGAETSNRGSGLGLALTKELVLLHRGEISLKSEKGKGACFRILLPIHQDSITQEAEELNDNLTSEALLAHENTDDDNAVVLIVDDNADVREYIKINLTDKYKIITANDGLEGLNKAIENIPDIILSDIMMPGIDGVELCKRLKTDERTSHIPVILLTARHSDETRVEGYETGADAYITKPFSTKLVMARITNLLEQRMKLRQLFSEVTPAELKKIATNTTDQTFLDKVVSLIDKNIENPEFDLERLSTILKMSRSQLYKKIKALTNQTVHDFMISIRMNRAKDLLLTGDYSVAETAYKIGYTHPTNFSRTFTKHFGITPTKFLEKHQK